MFADNTPFANPWRFQAHPEVWLLVAFLVGAYIYMARVIGPKAVPAGQRPVSRGQIACFASGMALLWIGADWPVHDIGEQYLYSVHMFQHMVLSYFVPPLVLLATPKWLFDAVIGRGPGRRAVRFLSRAVIAGVVFNIMVMITHIPALVNQSVSNGPLHYSLHILVVTASLLMWVPVLCPDPSWQISYGGKMIYLFLMSVVPTVPAAWLTFADGAVYKHYDIPVRVWGLSVTTDQQLAGAVMKTGGSIFLWTIVTFLFFRRFMARWSAEQTYRSSDTLTYEQVADEFERLEPAPEPRR